MTQPGWVQDAEERGYRECLLDVYCFLTGNETILDISGDRLARILNMVDQVNLKGGKLVEVTEGTTADCL